MDRSDCICICYIHTVITLLRASMSEWFRLLNFDYNHNAIDDS